MKILIISLTIDSKSAAGIIFKNLTYSLLEQGVKLIVVSQSLELENSPNLFPIINKSVFKLNIKLSKLLTLIFKSNWEYIVWQKFIFYRFRRKIKHLGPDLVFSFVSGSSPGMINLGESFARYLNVPFTLNMLDPIPPPKHYENYENYRLGLFPGIRNGLKLAKLVAIENPIMLNHQQSFCSFDLISKSIIVRNTIGRTFNYFGEPSLNEYNLLYLGTIGVRRNPINLIKAVCKLFDEGVKIKFCIVGDDQYDIGKLKLDDKYEYIISQKSWTDNIDLEMSQSNILVDIDIDMQDDVFSSSKVKQYLFVDRPILAITKKGSPTHDFLKELTNTVYFVDNSVSQIYEKINTIIAKNYNKDEYNEREKVLPDLSASNSARKLIEAFNKLITTP